MSDALKSNTTLTQLDLTCKDEKEQATQIAFINNTLFFIVIKIDSE